MKHAAAVMLERLGDPVPTRIHPGSERRQDSRGIPGGVLPEGPRYRFWGVQVRTLWDKGLGYLRIKVLGMAQYIRTPLGSHSYELHQLAELLWRGHGSSFGPSFSSVRLNPKT